MLAGKWVLRDLTWSLHQGEHWAVLGPNGAGKSTFLRLLRGEIWPAPVHGGTRIYALDGKPTQSPIGVERHIGLVSAEQQQQLWRQHSRRYRDDFSTTITVEQLVFTGLLHTELPTRSPRPAERKQVGLALERVGMTHMAAAPFDSLSQGQMRRALIARALVAQPRLLLLDEIGVGLDAPTRQALYALIQQLAEQGVTILMSSHRGDEFIPAISNILELREGRIAASGPRQRSAGQRLLRANRRGRLQDDWQPLTANDQAEREAAPFVVRLTHVSVSPELGQRAVLHNVNWRMNPGEHWLIKGDNGVGKSALLKLILGECRPAHGGQIAYFNSVAPRSVWEIKQRIGYVSAELQARYSADHTVEQVIASGFSASVNWLTPITTAQRKRVEEVIAQFHLQPLAKQSVQQLSYGQARRVFIARALVQRPALLILDEVFDGLDARARADLRAFLDVIAAEVSIILVSHHEEDLLDCITHRAILAGGCIIEQSVRTTHIRESQYKPGTIAARERKRSSA
ncbi:MAG: ATP-binding cassette domain-containing protein [Thermoflexales bacterium]